jgi:hypothetical protein
MIVCGRDPEESAMERKLEGNNNEEELVITPGGPRPKRLVRRVEAEEVVRFDKDGKGRIVRSNESQ